MSVLIRVSLHRFGKPHEVYHSSRGTETTLAKLQTLERASHFFLVISIHALLEINRQAM